MATTYKKQLPPKCKAEDFKYMGRPAKDQGDFGTDVGIVDMACVDQFGKNSSKYYHTGVLQAHGRWFAYYEWGRISGGKSWEGRRPDNYWFVECGDEAEARGCFQKKSLDKNTKRLVEKEIGGETIWVAKPKKDAYIVQQLATRERGLPDAYTIKDAAGVKTESKTTKKKKSTSAPTKTYQTQVVDLARSLVGGVQTFARAAAAATGVTPTMDAITKVRDKFLPAAGHRIAAITKANPQTKKEDDGEYDERLIDLQIEDEDMKDISKLVAAIVPRVIPRGTRHDGARSIILSSGNMLTIQQDLDAFEAALENEDFDVEEQDTGIDPDALMNAQIVWIDPNSTKGRWLHATFKGMSNNRHGYMRGRLTINNVFEVQRPDRDIKFVQEVKRIAAKYPRGYHPHTARLQPSKRSDLTDISDDVRAANVFLGIHGTRAVNVAPILQGNLRLPRSLPGAQITGAAFGHGIYAATDWRKSYGYTGYGNSYYGGGGEISGRGFFMFLQDVIMGDAYMTAQCGSWAKPPGSKDSIAAYPDFMYSLANDEHIIFDANHQRIRYIIEADFK